MLFGVSPKTHEPGRHLAQLVRNTQIQDKIRKTIKRILTDFLTLGVEEHFMTDYGDESSYSLPWDIYDEESAKLALNSAQRCISASEDIVKHIRRMRSKKTK